MSKTPSPQAAEAEAAVRTAETYGAVTGALATRETPVNAVELAAADASEAVRTRLEAFAGECECALREDGFSLYVSLPAATVPLARRIEALAAWVRGFLSGLGQAGARLDALDAESADMLRDLDAIARGASLEENASDAEEQAYAELVEYARLCTEHFYRLLG
ncbi:MAG: UPF0149 family protein [Gammaproteobacteria bacterium]